MYVVSQPLRTYVDQAGQVRSYDPDNITSGGLAGGCGCQHQGVLGGVLPESPTGKAALALGGVAVVVGGVLLYRRAKRGKRH